MVDGVFLPLFSIDYGLDQAVTHAKPPLLCKTSKVTRTGPCDHDLLAANDAFIIYQYVLKGSQTVLLQLREKKLGAVQE